MPGEHAQVLDQAPGEKQALKKVLMVDATAAATTLYNGCAVCYNRDYTGDGADEIEWGRATRVEQPITANLSWFAGLVTGLPSAGYALAASGSKRLTIIEGLPGTVAVCYAAAATYTFGQLLYISTGSYTINGTAGTVIGTSLQAVTLAAAGELQILLGGV